MGARVGVLLSGCGAYDGSDLHEAVLTLVALERRGARSICIAPDRPQQDVVNHLSGDSRPGEARQIWEEAARIARGKIEKPEAAVYGSLEALVVVGGFGVAKNLMIGFARPGEAHVAEPAVEAMIRALLKQRRPLGAVGLGKVLLSAVLDEDLFPGSELGSAERLSSDAVRRLYHAPGFLGAGRLPEVAVGIERMVDALLGVPALRVVE